MKIENAKPISQIRRESAPDQWYPSIRHSSMDLEELKQAKITQLDDLCEKEILAGFTSQTTGHFFRFSQYDQMNFTQQMLIMLADTNVSEVTWKTENAGVVTITRNDFLEVVREAEQHKRGLLERFWTLKAQVQAATTFEQIDAVDW